MSAFSSYQLGEPLLTIKDLRIEFGANLIVRDVNHTVRNILRADVSQGQIIALLGPSGRGKTQIFRRIAGLDKPTAGEIRVGLKQQIVDPGTVGVVFQDYTLFEHRTVWDNLLVASQQAGLPKGTIYEKIEMFLKAFGLLDRAKFYPADLSGGQRQRVAIMQQILRSSTNPEGFLLLMDEPFSGLDPVMIDQVCRVIVSITNLNELNTSFIVTHDVSAAVTVADHIILMGWQRNSDNTLIPGATIVETLDLIEMGLAWDPNLMGRPETQALISDIKTKKFPLL